MSPERPSERDDEREAAGEASPWTRPAVRAEPEPPALNVPGVVLALGAAFLLVHLYSDRFLDPAGRLDFLERFAFVPGFYGVEADRLPVPGARFWSPITYGFLHGDWVHAAINCVWLVAFGSAVAKRFGAGRFLVFTGLGFLAGAATHFLFYRGELVPLVGASGAVSAYFGAATRFALAPGRMGSDAALRMPALTLTQTLTTRSTVIFIAVWIGLNWITGSGLLPLAADGPSIAWEAHVGGFLLGLLGFSLFDRGNR